MPGTEFDVSDQTANATDAGETLSACVELVPFTPPLQRASAVIGLPRPDPCFVTQLIATAEQAPQTRNLRRATPADARSAYTTTWNQTREATQAASIRTQHTV